MEKIRLFRKRYIPDEIVELKKDTILLVNEDVIVTKWHVLKPRKDIESGISTYFLKRGYKISKIFNVHHELVYWYCDIIDTSYDPEKNSYVFTDLLIDVIVYPDKRVNVVDLDEFADVLESGNLPSDTLAKALRHSNDLLKAIYSGGFDELSQYIQSFEENETNIQTDQANV